MLASEDLIFDIAWGENSEDWVPCSDHQSNKVDNVELPLQSDSEIVISKCEDYNGQLKYLQNGPRDDEIHWKSIRGAFKQIVLIDPIVQDSDNNHNRHANGIDIGIEDQGKQLNQIVAVSISEIELGQLNYLVVLHLEQRVIA